MYKFPLKILHCPPPKKNKKNKKQGVWSQLKSAQADHSSDGCTFVPGFCNCLESRWGGPQDTPSSGGTCHHPKNRRNLWLFGPPKLVVTFFLAREMGDSGLFREIKAVNMMIWPDTIPKVFFFSNGSPEKVTEAKRFVELANHHHFLKVPFVELGECSIFFALQICPG